MKIFLILLFALIFKPAAFADVSFVTVSDEAAYENASDFSNTYEINFNRHGENKINKCQAVRLKEYWFLTAAHCVENACRDNCSFQARLIVGPNYEADITTTHTPDHPKIFKHSKANIKNLSSSYDLALLYFKPSESKLVYKDMIARIALSESQFLRRVPNDALYYKAVKGTNIPSILVMDSKEGKVLDRKLSVISIWDGKRDVLNNKKPVIFSPNTEIIFTENFGIRQGISGSGVMTNTGELAAVVSALGNVAILNKQTQKYDTVPLVYFSAIDRDALEFIQDKVGSVSYIEAGPEYYKDLNARQKTLLSALDKMNSAKK